MSTKPQHGYLVLADISGFTSYLAQVELDHAHEILADLLETIVGRFQTILTISKLEGDAVFAYTAAAKVTRGETLLELLESTYTAFRDRVEAARRRTTCTCRACQAIPTLDLKFFVHHGDYILQNVSGHEELLGSDVNLAHRLMKNHVTEATGWQAYALFTGKVLAHWEVTPEGMHEQIETYEHLGDIPTYSLHIRPRYEKLMAARRDVVTAEEAHLVTTRDYPVSPPVLWEWLNDPHKRSLYAFQEVKFYPVTLPGGRTDVGTLTHCVHGKKLAVVEKVLDWRPFDYFTVEQLSGPFTERATFRLTPLTEGSTRLEIYEHGRCTSIPFLDRLLTTFMLTRVMPTTKLLELMAQSIAKHSTQEELLK